MMTLIKLSVQLMTAAAALAVWLGISWTVDGIGLNPIIAYPLATACVFLPHLFKFETEED